jgi:hypothetical protein
MIGFTGTSLQLQLEQLTVNGLPRLAPFLTGLRVSPLPLWRMTSEESPPIGFCLASESELLYDWRFSPLRLMTSIFFSSTECLWSQSLCNILSNERMSLSFIIAAGPRQRSHSQVSIPRDSWPHFTVSDSRLSQLGGPGPRIYIPPEQGGPVIPRGNGVPFRRLLRLAGLRWRYSAPFHRAIFNKKLWEELLSFDCILFYATRSA